MSKVIQILRLCTQCAESLLGFVVVREPNSREAGKCEFCKKKKETDIYRVMSERSGKHID